MTGRPWPAPCAGVGSIPETILTEPSSYTSTHTGRAVKLAGAARCPVCGRSVAWTPASGIRRHAPKAPQ
jgi:hypothetical protein